MARYLAIILVSMLFSDTLLCAEAAVPPPVPPAVAKNYVVEAGDLLEISVWNEEDLKKEVLVRPDGGINFPILGEYHAGGKTVDRIADDLTKLLSEYISNPLVHVAVLKVGQSIYVLGNVNKPGEYFFPSQVDVMQALAMAGGLNIFADASDIKILHRDGKGGVVTLRFDYDDVSEGENLEQNIILRRGDVIIVP